MYVVCVRCVCALCVLLSGTNSVSCNVMLFVIPTLFNAFNLTFIFIVGVVTEDSDWGCCLCFVFFSKFQPCIADKTVANNKSLYSVISLYKNIPYKHDLYVFPPTLSFQNKQRVERV